MRHKKKKSSDKRKEPLKEGPCSALLLENKVGTKKEPRKEGWPKTCKKRKTETKDTYTQSMSVAPHLLTSRFGSRQDSVSQIPYLIPQLNFFSSHYYFGELRFFTVTGERVREGASARPETRWAN